MRCLLVLHSSLQKSGRKFIVVVAVACCSLFDVVAVPVAVVCCSLFVVCCLLFVVAVVVVVVDVVVVVV